MSLSLSSPSSTQFATTSSVMLPPDSEVDDPSNDDDDDSVNPRISSSMLAVTSTICIVIVIVAVCFVIFLMRRRRGMKRRSGPIISSTQSIDRLNRSKGSRTSRVRGKFGRHNDPPKNSAYELDTRVVEEYGIQDHSKHLSDLPPPYGVK